MPAGIDPGWAINPDLSQARTLVLRFNDQLAAKGEEDARAAITALWQTPPLPGIFARLPVQERLNLPVAVVPKLAEEMEAKSSIVTVSRDTLNVKLSEDRDRPTEVKTFANVQRLIDAGTVIERDQPNRRSVITKIDGVWWSTAIARSGPG